MNATDSVSVVLITRNRAADLRRALHELTVLPEAPPVIVVDNASTDETAGIVRQAGVRGIRLSRNAGAAARNVGVGAAASEYVAFSDDDSWWAPGALTKAARLFRRFPRLGLIAARVLVGAQNKLDTVCLQMAASPLPRAPDAPGPSVLGFVACGAIVRRTAFLQAGGFHREMGVGGEEQLLAIDLCRHGWSLAYCDDVVAHHHPAGQGVRPGRKTRMARNELWTAWLRYRPRDALKVTANLAWSAPSGTLAALVGLPWVLRERIAIDLPLQKQLRQLQ